MSIASDGMNNWRGNLSVDIFPIDSMKLDSSDDFDQRQYAFRVYPRAIEQTESKKPMRSEREEQYDIVWDDTGESILPIVELSEIY
ncbi:MAG: hypothetical protein ACFFD6_07775 [Candidatus Thorarchaeota archaeon]